MRLYLIFALLLCSTLSFAQGTCGSGVIITEIHNRPAKPDQATLDAAFADPALGNVDGDTSPNEGHTEWFEIYNTTGSPIVMDGWTIQDASSSSGTSVIGTFTIAPYSYAVFAGFNIPAAQGGVVFDYFYDYKKPSFNNESTYTTSSSVLNNCPDGVRISTTRRLFKNFYDVDC